MATDESAEPTAPRRVIVKFRDTVIIPYEDGAERHLTRLGVGPWTELARRFDGIRLTRLFTVVSPDRLGELVAQASDRDRHYRAPNLLTFFTIVCPPERDAGALAAALREWPQVETAYVDPLDKPPAPPGTNTYYAKQTYLQPPATSLFSAPGAIDAEFAWLQPGGTGQGQKIVDLERGAKLTHEDLPAGIPTLHGVMDFGYMPHGTSVIGILAAVDNGKGVIGIAHGVDEVTYSCQVLADHSVDRIGAVMAAIQHFTQPGEEAFGRVLLLEVELNSDVNPADLGQLTDVNGVVWKSMPMETAQADFDVIRLATALGIVVVEPTGNGLNDLDAFQQAGTGDFVLSRAKPGARDSGAIMVGGSTPSFPYQRSVWNADPTAGPIQGTSFGSRVDCFAWADGVCTCACTIGVLSVPPFLTWLDDPNYPSTFNGTSAASAIVAGAVLLVQGVAAKVLGRRLSPDEMRDRVSDPDPTVNTLSQNPGVDLIGVMPNLRGILTRLGVAPDVYMRDYVGDTGVVPSTGVISLSPDIIVRPAPEANPGVAFGPGTENDLTLGSTVSSGRDNFVYVRVWNRGDVTATAVTATVFYASAATLLTPINWQLIGSVVIPSVAGGNVMTVSAAITWPAASVPLIGHYCFIAFVGSAQDPAPNPASFNSFDYYYAFIRSNNNVTWKNFDVVPVAPPVAGAPRKVAKH